jgi:hypothetical protein
MICGARACCCAGNIPNSHHAAMHASGAVAVSAGTTAPGSTAAASPATPLAVHAMCCAVLNSCLLDTLSSAHPASSAQPAWARGTAAHTDAVMLCRTQRPAATAARCEAQLLQVICCTVQYHATSCRHAVSDKVQDYAAHDHAVCFDATMPGLVQSKKHTT